MKKASWGNKWLHLLGLVFTIGIFNLIYLLYHRLIKAKKRSVGEPPGWVHRQLTLKNLVRILSRSVRVWD